MTQFAPLPGLLPPDTDWTYDKKREAQEIVPGLWLGPWAAAKDRTFIEKNISHVFIVRSPEEEKFIKAKFPESIQYQVLQCRDNSFENLIRFFPDVITYVDEVLKQRGNILIHGNAGMSRSATFVIAYIMTTFKLSYKEAHKYVLTRRHCISLIDGFQTQLKEYETIVAARLASSREPFISPSGSTIHAIRCPQGQKRPRLDVGVDC